MMVNGHVCEEKEDIVEVYRDWCTNDWHLQINGSAYMGWAESIYTGLKMDLGGIRFCPFCGERLEPEDD